MPGNPLQTFWIPMTNGIAYLALSSVNKIKGLTLSIDVNSFFITANVSK
jgi:hypothetical protein